MLYKNDIEGKKFLKLKGAQFSNEGYSKEDCDIIQAIIDHAKSLSP